MKRAACVILLLCVAAAEAQSPYDVIEGAYRPYLSDGDPLALPLKIHALADSQYKFWRGSKDLFFLWCAANTTDWLADRESYVETHGDLHLGNIGTYPTARGINNLAFGMVDFDDCATLPFQIELLQGLITLQLTARQNGIELTPSRQGALLEQLLAAYRVALNSQRSATAMLVDAHDPLVLGMLSRSAEPYESELERFTSDRRFREAVRNDRGKLTDILRPAMSQADALADGLAQAVVNEPDLRRAFRYRDADQFRAAILDAAQRCRLGSSGSQGLKKYLVLLRRPLPGREHDVIVYLKQAIPSAAERSGVVPPDPRTPAQRVKQTMDRMNDPWPYPSSWCQVGGESYWVTVKEPWSDELEADSIKSFDDLEHAARTWGVVAGAAHRCNGRFATILSRLTPDLTMELQRRAQAYLLNLESVFQAFRDDPRTCQQVGRAAARLADARGTKS